MLPNAAAIDDGTSPLYFLHIPKTAGTTFNGFLESQFSPADICPAHLWRQLVALPKADVAGKRLIWGHFYSFLHRALPSPVRYLTFFRDPVERALSHYGHVLQHQEHYLHRRAVELGSFRGFLRDPETATTVVNFQLRSIAVDHEPYAIAERLTPEALAGGELERRLMTAPFDQSIEEMLATAKIRLAQMCFVGITERYQESVELLCKRLRWRPPGAMTARNVNEQRPRQHQIDPDDLVLVRELNRADYDLYELACRRLVSDLTGEG